MKHKRMCLALGIIALGLCGAAPVGACGLDGVPSISANGVLAHPNTARASRGNLGHWAKFVFPAGAPAGRPVRLSEDQRELHRSLPPQAFGTPWRWTYGDGTAGSGYTVSHAFAHPGLYKIIVSAYYSSYRAWFEFDEALITITPAHAG